MTSAERSERDEKIKALAAKGLSKIEVSRELGCSRDSIYEWAKLWPEIHFNDGRCGQNSLRGEIFGKVRAARLGLKPSEMADLKTLIKRGKYLERDAVEIIKGWRNPRRLTATPREGMTHG